MGPGPIFFGPIFSIFFCSYFFWFSVCEWKLSSFLRKNGPVPFSLFRIQAEAGVDLVEKVACPLFPPFFASILLL